MGRIKVNSYVDKTTLLAAEKDLDSLSQGPVSTRLLAVINAGKGKQLKEIADFLCMTRQSAASWIQKYKAEGVQGLHDRPKGHRIKRLGPKQEAKIQEWIDRGESPRGEPCHWTVDKVKAAIEEQFGVTLSRSRVGYLIQEWGFRPKVPRPKHAEGDPEAQEAFKKTPRKSRGNPKRR